MTLQIKTKRYSAARQWSDGYDPAMNQIAAGIMYTNNLMGVYFVRPTLDEDRKRGIDQWVETERMKFSYRIREAKYKDYFMEGFTIRNTSLYGETELDKLHRDDYADFLLYAVAHPDNYGEVDVAVLIDLKSVGSQLKQYPHILRTAHKGNGFVEFNYDAFPHPVVVGMYGVQEKKKEVELCL